MRSHDHININPAAKTVRVHLGDRDLAQVTPSAGVGEEVMPLLQHPPFGAGPGATMDAVGGVLCRAGRPLRHGLRRAHVVARREDRSGRGQDHDAHGVIGLGRGERVVEFDQQAAVLSVLSLRPVEGDARDRSFVERLVRDEAVGHLAFPIWSWPFGNVVCCSFRGHQRAF